MATTHKNGPRTQPGAQSSGQPGSSGQSLAQPRARGVERRESQRLLGSLDRMRALSPFSMMRRVFEDMERMIEQFGGGELEQPEDRAFGLDWSPRVDVRRRDGQVVVSADLPGLAPEDVRVSIADHSLVIEGERRFDRVDEREDVYRAERIYGRFRRAIPLPEGVEVDSAEARFDNGVLEISVRAPDAEGRGREIEIQAGQPRTEGGRS